MLDRAFGAVVVGNWRNDVSIVRERGAGTRHFQASNPLRDHLDFRWTSPTATTPTPQIAATPRIARLVNAVGRQFALGASEDRGAGRNRVRVPPGRAAGVYVLTVEGESVVVVRQ